MFSCAPLPKRERMRWQTRYWVGGANALRPSKSMPARSGEQTMNRRFIAAATLLTLAFSSSVVSPSLAAPQTHKMTSHKMAPKMAPKKGVYVCRSCKMYFSAQAAKKMGYKDPMGHKLVKMASAPSGYMKGSKMLMNKMKGEMGNMDTGKNKM
jgi:hypothetical protein